MKAPRALAVATLGASAVLLAGCGSSRLSHDEYSRRADAVCSRYDAAVARLRRPRRLVEVERYARRVLPLYRRALAELAALEPPKDDEASVRAWLSADRGVERDLRALAAAARARDIVRLGQVVRKARADDRRSNRIARRLGLRVCSRP